MDEPYRWALVQTVNQRAAYAFTLCPVRSRLVKAPKTVVDSGMRLPTECVGDARGMKPGLWGTHHRMRPGVLDVGSNSAQLQIVDVSPGAPPLPAHAIKEPTLLGEEIGPDGTVGRSGVERVNGGDQRDPVGGTAGRTCCIRL
jgi:hypothetical protein